MAPLLAIAKTLVAISWRRSSSRSSLFVPPACACCSHAQGFGHLPYRGSVMTVTQLGEGVPTYSRAQRAKRLIIKIDLSYLSRALKCENQSHLPTYPGSQTTHNRPPMWQVPETPGLCGLTHRGSKLDGGVSQGPCTFWAVVPIRGSTPRANGRFTILQHGGRGAWSASSRYSTPEKTCEI